MSGGRVFLCQLQVVMEQSHSRAAISERVMPRSLESRHARFGIFIGQVFGYRMDTLKRTLQHLAPQERAPTAFACSSVKAGQMRCRSTAGLAGTKGLAAIRVASHAA